MTVAVQATRGHENDRLGSREQCRQEDTLVELAQSALDRATRNFGGWLLAGPPKVWHVPNFLRTGGKR